MPILLLLATGCREFSQVEDSYPGGKPKQIITKNLSLSGDTTTILLETFYFSGSPKLRVEMNGNVMHGQAIEWWQKKRLKAEGNYSSDLKEGSWKYYHRNGKDLQSEGQYASGKKSGPWTSYWPGGHIRSQGNFIRGDSSGSWEFWDTSMIMTETNSCFSVNPEGERIMYWPVRSRKLLKTQIQCRNGIPMGKTTGWYPNGDTLLKGQYDIEGRKTGLWRIFHQNGNDSLMETWSHGIQMDSAWTWNHRGLTVRKAWFDSGRGTSVHYDSLGIVSLRSEWSGGKKNGFSRTYFPGGQVKTESLYRNDTIRSLQGWHPVKNNQLPVIAYTGTFRQGTKHGPWKTWNDEGILVEETSFKNGLKHGKSRHYGPDGKLLKTIEFERGQPGQSYLGIQKP